MPPATPPHLPCHRITELVSHLICPLPPHHIYHVIALVSHLTCPLPSNHIYCITTLVSHLTCPLPPDHIYGVTASLGYHVSQSFDLPPATTPHLPRYRITMLPCYRISQYLTCPLPPHHIYCITILVSHLTCPLLPHHIYCITASLRYHVSQSFDLSPGTPPHLLCHQITESLPYPITALVSHLTCPLPPHHIYHVTALQRYHVSQSFDLPTAKPTTFTASPR